MFICICTAVSDGVIADSIRRGASTVAQVARSCDAGTGCGTCHIRIRQMLAQHHSASAPLNDCAQGRGDLVEALHRPAPPRSAAGPRRAGVVGRDRHATNRAANPTPA